MAEQAIPKEVQDPVLGRLHEHTLRYLVYGVTGVGVRFAGPYLYIDYTMIAWDPFTPALGPQQPQKLCRLRYTGDPDYWEFAIYKYSDEAYDEEGEFPFSGGTVEECFDAAASLYIAHCYPNLKPDLPTLEELEELLSSLILGWELEDGTFVPGPAMVDELIELTLQDRRKRVEEKPIQVDTKLQAALNKQPAVWVEAIYGALELRGARRARERVKEIAAKLPEAGFLREVLARLPQEAHEALRLVLERGGWIKYGQLTRRFGSDAGDGWFWNERPPTSILGRLRLYGLLFVGRAALGGRRWKVGVIPVELRDPLREILL
jgi:hypothetical protein